MRKTFFAFLLLVSLLAPSTLLAQATVKITPDERKAAETITAKQISEYLHFVASDEMEGRDTPSRGLDLTAKFIAMMLSRWGFKPAGDNGTFFQKIALKRDSIDSAATSIEVNGKKFGYGEDLLRASGSSAGNISAPIVFAGDGWMIKSKNLNPYAGIDVKGKYIAVLGEGEMSGRTLIPLPAGVTQADLSGERGKDWADVAMYARQNAAAGIIILPSKFLTENWTFLGQMFGRNRVTVEKFAQPATGGAASAPNVFFASPELARAIFAGEAGNPMDGSAKNSFDLSANKKANINVAMKPETLWTQNVVAVWEGSDPTLKAEMVAIGAHYDHVGVNPNARGDDKIFNGADDDGSGTVAVLSIAEALAKMPKRPKRSVLFVWHTGEEKGLWGSQYFNQFPTVDLSKVITQLNIDMIGRSKKPNYQAPCDLNPAPGRKPCNAELSGENEIYVIGSEMMSSTLGAVTKGANDGYLKLNYNYRYDDPKDPNRFFFRSDHFNYAQKGIPVVFWFDGEHEDYHGAGDHPDKIDYPKMEKVTRTIFLTLLELTDLKTRPAIDKQLPKELTR